MDKKRKNIVVSKKGSQYVVTDKQTGRRLYQVEDKPVYDAFELKHSFIAGIGSSIGVAGNYFSFKKYLETNNDADAIASDWKQVGMSFLEVLSEWKCKL